MKNRIPKAPCAPPGSQSPAPPRPTALSSMEATAQGTASAQCCSPWGQGGWETGLSGSLQRLWHNCPSCRQRHGALTEASSKGRQRGEVRAQISFCSRWIQGCAVAGALSSLWKPRKSFEKSEIASLPICQRRGQGKWVRRGQGCSRRGCLGCPHKVCVQKVSASPELRPALQELHRSPAQPSEGQVDWHTCENTAGSFL